MKEILIDLTNLRNPTCGFGQIQLNYVKLFTEKALNEANEDQLHFNFLIPQGLPLNLPAEISTFPCRKKLNLYFPFTLPRADVWHITNQQQRLLRKARGTKVIYTIHDLNFLQEKSSLSIRKHLFRIQRRINQADAVVAVTQYTADVVKNNLDLKGKEVRVIYNGVENIVSNSQSRPRFVVDTADGNGIQPFFFTIGQIRKKKNFHILVDMMRYFPNHQLYISGQDTFDYANEIREQIKAGGLNNVHLTGPVTQEEKVWLYSHCTAFLFPSQGEGFGLPPIEAMQFGKPVFAANRTCLSEVCGNAAFMIDDLTSEAFANSINSHLPHFYDHADRIEAVRQHANSFSYKKHIDAYYQLYKKLSQE